VESTLYLHVLNMGSLADTERFRRSVLATERRIVLAIGSREDAKRLRRVSGEELDRERESADRSTRDVNSQKGLNR
jgi:hypothetical protein